MRPEPSPAGDAHAFLGRDDVPPAGVLLRALSRGAGESLVLLGPAGSGKSSVLRGWEAEALRGGAVLPVYVRVPAAGIDLAGFAAGALEAFAGACLAFRGAPAAGVPGMEAQLASLRSAWPEAADALGGEALRLAGLGPGSSPAAALARVPGELARRTGVPVLCLCDDVQNLARLGPRALAVWPVVPGPGRAAVVFACREGAPLGRLLGPDRAEVRTVRLGPLPDAVADQLLRQRAVAAGIGLGEDARRAALALTGGRPRYLEVLLRELEAGGGAEPLDVARAYGASVADGELGTAWAARLAEALPSRPVRAVALEILSHCLREGVDAPDASRLAAIVFRGGEETARALEGLIRAGVARVDCRLVRVDPDPVLRDVVRALHRRESGGAPAEAVSALATAEAVRSLGEAGVRREAAALRSALRAILAAWAGRSVPAVLFDAAGFAALGGVLPEAGGGDQVALPRMAATASGRIGISTSPAGLDMDAVGWGWRGEPGDPEAEVVWAVRSVPGGAEAAGAIRELDRAVAALQAAGDLPPARVVRWAILAGDPDPAAAAAAAELRVATSTPAALRALAGLLGLALRIPEPWRRPSPGALEFEMTIPAAADAELVAARALEQVAELAELGEDEARRVRTALVEACINAFEHSGAVGARVRLVFTVTREELRVRVENRGRPLGPGALVAARGEGGEGRRRGWGLRLMRELVDRVELEPREDGVTLVLAKRIARRDG